MERNRNYQSPALQRGHVAYPASSYKPEDDGVTHINIFPHGNTPLGRRLAPFANISFDHPYHGSFCSLEGFWHWLRTGRKDDQLRLLTGMAAKVRGRESESSYYAPFQDEIVGANYQKIIQHNYLLDDFVSSTLPFTYYYLMEENGQKVMRPGSGGPWIVDGLETLRQEMREGQTPKVWTRCEAIYRDLEVTDAPYIYTGTEPPLIQVETKARQKSALLSHTPKSGH